MAQDDDAVMRFVGRFAEELVNAGMGRMPARVWVLLLATDTGRLTAAEIAEKLQISPAAVSGAVRYLITVNMIAREREPGARKDHYRVFEQSWYEALANRDVLLNRWAAALGEGAQALGESPAGHRIRESQEFIEFMQDELAQMLGRWRERKRQR
ncbi:MarR family transcriptional regulator [Kineosporia sp. J2-2]|uniref:MarR family transcriptional regulator n=1 Tax=Kineosporia corallincola TaxID=2835133 RepID=A0ABS5TJ98_9ACTN|nr:MarR family transcriptional regulator [Kineosporia corallincola]MBT0771183.1 MarR family transcriptional regulator [Kineosporia corallincola]